MKEGAGVDIPDHRRGFPFLRSAVPGVQQQIIHDRAGTLVAGGIAGGRFVARHRFGSPLTAGVTVLSFLAGCCAGHPPRWGMPGTAKPS